MYKYVIWNQREEIELYAEKTMLDLYNKCILPFRKYWSLKKV